jgi:hypothetical protein
MSSYVPTSHPRPPARKAVSLPQRQVAIARGGLTLNCIILK